MKLYRLGGMRFQQLINLISGIDSVSADPRPNSRTEPNEPYCTSPGSGGLYHNRNDRWRPTRRAVQPVDAWLKLSNEQENNEKMRNNTLPSNVSAQAIASARHRAGGPQLPSACDTPKLRRQV